MILFLAKALIARNPALTMAHAQRLAKAGLVVASVIIIAGMLIWWQAAQRAHDAETRAIGATIQREEDLRTIITRTEQAHETRDTITQDFNAGAGRSCELYHQCLRTARTAEHCQRFLPQRQKDQCRAAPEDAGRGSGRP